MNVNLTAEMVTSRVWRFCHRDGSAMSDHVTFQADGSIEGHKGTSERRWRIEEGVLVLMNVKGADTTRLNSCLQTDAGFALSGKHLVNTTMSVHLREKTTPLTRIGGTRDALADQIAKYGWTIGDHTYGVPSFIAPGEADLTIGKYVAIANGVTICFADHRTDMVSTYPFILKRRFWPGAPDDVTDHRVRGPIVIGNDVWIGGGVFIASGVTIGHGAVIGARSVVTRDVAPYGLVVGAPARLVRHRFPPRIVDALLALAWWHWPDEKVDQHLELMLSDDIEAFIKAAGGRIGPAAPQAEELPPAPADKPRRGWLGLRQKT